MFWTNLDHKKIGIWGMGREGSATLLALNRHAPHARIIEITENNLSDIFGCDVLIKSPGVSLYRPEITEARQKGIQITSGTNLFFANKDPKVPVIAVTGTKGKSTTASLLAHTLKFFKKTVLLGGNIGKPLIDFVDEPADFVVAELSSYQCADLTGRPDIGIITNLYPEHLQWHGSHEQYYRDKLNLTHQSNHLILNAADPRLSAFLTQKNTFPFNLKTGIHVQDDFFCDGSQKLFEIKTLPLLGRHNAENACAVLETIRLLNLSLTECQTAFHDFKPLPHRLQILGTKNSVTYVDDSISTTPETAIAAIRALDSGQFITLIAGGFDRGQDFTSLVDFLKSYKTRFHLVTLPDTGVRLSKEAKKADIPTSQASDMASAVRKAQQITPENGTILLSPAAPSYNSYRNFEERGTDFARLSGFTGI